ncbi:MAG: 4Fe-4S ferredoxin [Planctomycetota bacterium]
MSESPAASSLASPERPSVAVDVACVGFGPAAAGFLETISRGLANPDGTPRIQSRAMPGMPLQVLCYERSDDVGFGVSGVVTRARGIRASFPDLDPATIPTACRVEHEEVAYLLDPIGASRRGLLLRTKDAFLRTFARILGVRDHAFRLPWLPPFLRKDGGLTFSLGAFQQWNAARLMGTGLVQIWPGSPVREPLFEGDRVVGIRLADQGVEKDGKPAAGFSPGMDVRADLVVVADGPVGPVGDALNRRFGMPPGHHRREWAIGMKAVAELPESSSLKPGTVLHTLGFPEPDAFGFLYALSNRTVSFGIFLPSTFALPVRATYRYLQHWMAHPYIRRHLEGATLRSWGAKTLYESGRLGEPLLVDEGWARIGEGSGSTNVLTNSGVDEAWTTGVLLAEGVLEIAAAGKPYTRENLEAAYVRRRRTHPMDRESRIATHARDGFRIGFIPGVVGTGLAGMTRGLLRVPARSRPAHAFIRPLEEAYRGRIPAEEIEKMRREAAAAGGSIHDALMDRAGWPRPALDGKLFVSHQDALLLGGKVQAPAGFADHVVFVDRATCEACTIKSCVEACSAQAITLAPEGGVPVFDREKCIHCGGCIWNCAHPRPGDPERSNVDFRAGAGGLHSAEN